MIEPELLCYVTYNFTYKQSKTVCLETTIKFIKFIIVIHFLEFELYFSVAMCYFNFTAICDRKIYIEKQFDISAHFCSDKDNRHDTRQ